MKYSKILFLIKGWRKKIPEFTIPSSVKIRSGVILQVGKKCSRILCSENVDLRQNTLIEANGSLRIGKNSVVGYSNWIQCDGEITIGEGVLIGPHVNIVASSHYYGPNIDLQSSSLKRGSIMIKNHVWVGAGATIASGVTIGENAVIGANSFVNKNVPENTVYAGVPAKFIKKIE